MFMTDNIEVFVTRNDCPNISRTEYVSAKPKGQGVAREQTFIAAHDNEGYGVAIVFGKDFEISPPIPATEADCKESAVRIRIIIDGGIAVKQCIYKSTDLRQHSGVHFVGVFGSASVGEDGTIQRYRLYFSEVPFSMVELSPLVEGLKMPSDLKQKIGHIDVELERGYLDFDKNIDRFIPSRVPSAFHPGWFTSNNSKTHSFRTRLKVYTKEDAAPAPSHGGFKASEPAKRLRISYCSEDLIKVGVANGKIVLRESSDAWRTSIRLLEARLKELLDVSPKPTRPEKLLSHGYDTPGNHSEKQSELKTPDELIKAQRKATKKEKRRQRKLEAELQSPKRASPRGVHQVADTTKTTSEGDKQALLSIPSKRKKSNAAKPETARKPKVSENTAKTPESNFKKATEMPSTPRGRQDSRIEISSTSKSSRKRKLLTDALDVETIKAMKKDYTADVHREYTPCRFTQKKVSRVDLTQDTSSEEEHFLSNDQPLASTVVTRRNSGDDAQRPEHYVIPTITAADPATAINDLQRLYTKPAIPGPSTATSPQPTESSTRPGSPRRLQIKSAAPSADHTKFNDAILGEANASSPSKSFWQPRIPTANASRRPEASTRSAESQTIHEISSCDLKIRLAKLNYEIALAETAGQKQSTEEVLLKKIECREGQIELNRRDLKALRERLAEKTTDNKK